jgi:hypothetical protein
LLIGVAESGEALGLDADGFPNEHLRPPAFRRSGQAEGAGDPLREGAKASFRERWELADDLLKTDRIRHVNCRNG